MYDLAVAARTPKLRDALARQAAVGAWAMADESGEVFRRGDLSVFADHPARYYLVSIDDDALADGLATRGTLLYLIVKVEVGALGLLLLESAHGYIGAILSGSAFYGHEAIPCRRALLADLIDHARALGVPMGSMFMTEHAVSDPVEPPPVAGWRTGVPQSIDAAPPEPTLYTCTSNDIYGDAAMLRAYCGVAELPIVGRVQHGWEPGPGVVINAMEDTAFTHYFVWNAGIARERMDLVRVQRGSRMYLPQQHTRPATGGGPSRIKLVSVGAPYLYLPEAPDVGPRGNWLLAVPGHGIADSPRARPWEAYLSALGDFAQARGFERVSVLIYPDDDEKPDLRHAVRARGFVPLSCGRSSDLAWLLRTRDFIRQHAAVTSDRVCTAGMYALLENRPFFLVGVGAVQHDPPDAYADLVTDPAWIAQHYPGIWRGGLEGREEALRELGEKLEPGALRRRLYAWIWDGPETVPEGAAEDMP